MAVVKLYGSPKSTCTRRVAAVLREKCVPYELIPITLGQNNNTPEYLQMQPFGQVPVLDDNGYILYESRAIGRYLALKYRNQGTQGLVPDHNDAEATGKFEEACSLEYSQFNPPAEGLAQELIFKKYRGEETDHAAVAKLYALLAKRLDVYDQILSKRKYLAGGEFTIADLFHLPYAEVLINVIKSDAINIRPHVLRWWLDISCRESWQAVKDGA